MVCSPFSAPTTPLRSIRYYAEESAIKIGTLPFFIRVAGEDEARNGRLGDVLTLLFCVGLCVHLAT